MMIRDQTYRERLKMRIIPLLAMAIVSGCATQGKYEAKLNSMIGYSEIDVVSTFGLPERSYEIGEHKFIKYSDNSTGYIPATSPSYTTTFIGNKAYTQAYGGTSAINVDFNCNTTFDIVDGYVRDWRISGNNCVSY